MQVIIAVMIHQKRESTGFSSPPNLWLSVKSKCSESIGVIRLFIFDTCGVLAGVHPGVQAGVGDLGAGIAKSSEHQAQACEVR